MVESTTFEPVPVLDEFRQIAGFYDVILCDVWGVLHNGRGAHVEAGKALRHFRELAGERPRRVVLISNAPRPWTGVQTILDGYSIPRDAYDLIVTSGDLAQRLIGETRKQRIYHLGPDRDLPIFTGCDIALTSLDDAELCVCTGLFDDDTETAEDYGDSLAFLRDRHIPMICANPDLYVEREGRLIPCAGLIGEAYDAMGGEVVYAGKPYAPIYREALRMVAERDGPAIPEASRVLAIGDSIRTDIAGAAGCGIATLFIARGIHAEELGLPNGTEQLGEIQPWLLQQKTRPDAVMMHLAW